MREAVESTLPSNVETRKIHAHSCLISFITHELCLCAKDIPTQSAMTLGLLHDLGKGVQIVMKNANWTIHEYVDTFDSARLGADLLRKWALPERLCQMVEIQEQPEFTPPDLMPAELRREVGLLHIAHVLASMVTRETPVSIIYTRDYMAAVGINGTPEAFLKDRVIPALTRNLRRLPQGVQDMVKSSL
jgi:HD-like signal output (HDOD) protein